MKRSTLQLIFVTAGLFLLALILTQIFWVKKAYEIEQKQFGHNVTDALLNVVHEIERKDSVHIYDPVEQITPAYYIIRLQDTLLPEYLESLLKTELTKLEINERFDFNIYDCFKDEIVFQRDNAISLSDEQQSNFPNIHWHRDNGHNFSIYFPEQNHTSWAQMDFWVYSSIILAGVIFFFVFLIIITLKQKRLDELKTDFINNMTHEFKTPISSIALSSDVLLKDGIEKKPEKLKNYVKIIHNENNRLQKQVERILQIGSLEKENIRLNKKEVDINLIAQKAINTFQMNVQAKQGKIEAHLNAVRSTIKADEVHFTNILYNLVDNAIKYCDKVPDIRIETKNEKNGIRISVIDNGPGISKEEQKHIFDKFYRIPTGNIHDVKGYGIGLNYVKLMVQQHSGKIILRSDKGKGVDFSIVLPTT